MVRRWEAYLKVSRWTSEYLSVNNLLRYLKNRKIGSEASRDVYGRALYAFCLYTGKLPDEFVGMKKADIEKLVEDFCYHKKEAGCSARTVNTALFMLKTFFKVNGFKGNEKLEVESYHQPVRARTRDEYIPTLDEARRMANVAGSLRNRAIILFMISTGLRNATLRAVLYGEVKEELEKGLANILIKVHATMKSVVSSACKGNIEYSVFTSEEATEALRLYIDDRRRRFDEIHDQEPLFPSEYNRLSRRERVCKPLTGRELQVIVKKAAAKAGIKEWMNVTPHCLRKTFESVLRSRLADGGRLDVKTQEYFMGHILAGSMDTYFDKSKVDELRKEYGKLIFTTHDGGKVEALESLRVVVEALGIDCAQLTDSKKGELGRDLNSEEKLQLLQETAKQVVRRFMDVNKFEGKVPSVPELSKRTPGTQGSMGQTLLIPMDKQIKNNSLRKNPSVESSLSMVWSKDNKQTCTQVKQERRLVSRQLTSYMMPQENSHRTKPPFNDRQQTELKSKVRTDLTSFFQSTS